MATDLRISCDECVMEGTTACDDCVVSFLRGREPGDAVVIDVTTTTRVRAFHHFSVGGELSVEEPEVLSETVDEVLCRGCGTGGAVEVVVTPPA